MAGPPRPLEGIKVLDLSRVLSGPYAGRMLADLGADVVKVEPPEGDVSRNWGAEVDGRSGFYEQQNAGKRGICVDLKQPDGVALVARLAGAADLLIENFRPGVLARLGLPIPALMEANPRLIVLSITGFGQTGPESGRAAYAPVVQAEAGLLLRQAELDGRVAADYVISIADTYAGLHGMVALLAALHLRDRTGRGQHIDLAMLDALLAVDDYVHHAVDGSPLVRLGGEVWETGCGPILLAGERRFQWVALTKAHGIVDPAPPGSDLPAKAAAREGALRAWFAAFDDRAALLAALDAAGVAWADLRTTAEAIDSPQSRHREVVADLDGRRVIQTPFRFSDATCGARTRAPTLDEHRAEVIADWLR